MNWQTPVVHDHDDEPSDPKAGRFAALKRAKELDRHMPDGFWGADQPKCPHCGEVCDISENDWWKLYEEGEHEVTCPHCDGDFTVSTRVSYSFSTENQEDA